MSNQPGPSPQPPDSQSPTPTDGVVETPDHEDRFPSGESDGRIREKLFRRVIVIKAEYSPNVILGLAQRSLGIRPTGEMVMPGVLSWDEYLERRATWDKIRQCIGLDAQFWEGAEVLMFPPEWLNLAEQFAREMALAGRQRKAKAIGIDPAEGGDQTSMVAIDELGIIEVSSKKTPNTAVIVGEAKAFMRKHDVPDYMVAMDRGGGGKQHADLLREDGYEVRTIAFGESLNLLPKRGMRKLEDKIEHLEERYAYVNRRAEMYGELREVLDPSINKIGFAIPGYYANLRQELAPIPLLYDREGRMRLLPKNKKDPDSKEKTLTELIGHSPDEADALVLALHCMRHKVKRVMAGGV